MIKGYFKLTFIIHINAAPRSDAFVVISVVGSYTNRHRIVTKYRKLTPNLLCFVYTSALKSKTKKEDAVVKQILHSITRNKKTNTILQFLSKELTFTGLIV